MEWDYQRRGWNYVSEERGIGEYPTLGEAHSADRKAGE
jgi:hypothetical protein